MYEVQMKYMDESNQGLFNFSCERYNIENDRYRFENIVMNNFRIVDLEVNHEDIALIKIK